MATEKQIEANRRNAQQSTGPRTAEGKAAARRNALSSGIYADREAILPCENPQDLETLAAEYHQRYRPTTPEVRCLVDSLVSDEWLLRRFRTIEAQLMDRAIRSTSYPEQHTPLGQAYARAENQLERLQRRINATRRNYLQALKMLQALETQKEDVGDAPASPEPEPDRIPPSVENQPLTPGIGFVPSPSQITASRRPEAPSTNVVRRVKPGPITRFPRRRGCSPRPQIQKEDKNAAIRPDLVLVGFSLLRGE